MLKRVTLVHNVSTDPDGACRKKVESLLTTHPIDISVVTVEARDCPVIPLEAQDVDMVMVLGGDGTFLRTAQALVQKEVPLVGINTGTLGFLTRIEADRIPLYIDRLVQGLYTLEERMTLAVNDVSRLALNDVLIKSANPSQMISLRLYIHNTLVATYDADGIIIATPTGSTAYNLSAGGPVISPEVEALAITAICPHSLSAKPVVIPADKHLRIESAAGKNQMAICSIDGQEHSTLRNGESIQVFRSPLSFKMVNFQMEEDDFYWLLKKKLHWSMNPRWKTPV